MAQIQKWLKCDLQKMVKVDQSRGNAFYQDSGANLIGVEITDGGQSVSLQSTTVTGYIMTESGEMLTVTGSKQGNRVWIELPDAAYDEQGHISVFIKLKKSGVVTTVGALEGKVYKGWG